mmetsp:Transcript_25456/g.67916  ORF Transcript_25456/g.67916 Transcript_25456/m.67916 type:complete len:208 (+) Transcript_25456:430-1053(+)
MGRPEATDVLLGDGFRFDEPLAASGWDARCVTGGAEEALPPASLEKPALPEDASSVALMEALVSTASGRFVVLDGLRVSVLEFFEGDLETFEDILCSLAAAGALRRPCCWGRWRCGLGSDGSAGEGSDFVTATFGPSSSGSVHACFSLSTDLLLNAELASRTAAQSSSLMPPRKNSNHFSFVTWPLLPPIIWKTSLAENPVSFSMSM